MVTSIGCVPDPHQDPVVIKLNKDIPAEFGNRFQIKITSEFRDDYAYDGRRRIYILTDTKTGHEYVGISGVGISELNSHQDMTTINSKTTKTVQDER